MKLLSTIALIVFFFALAFDCYFIISNNNDMRFISKALLMPLLLIYFITETKLSQSKTSKNLVFAALLCSFVGDIFLLFENEQSYFMAGIGAFLAAHILYIIFFIRLKRNTKKNIFLLIVSIIAVFAYSFFILKIIWDGILKSNIQIPVIIYVVVISIMLIASINTAAGGIKKIAVFYFIPGALLFATSDSILSINNYAFPFKNAPVIVMISYAFAQFLIVTGCVKILSKQKKSRSKKRRSGSIDE